MKLLARHYRIWQFLKWHLPFMVIFHVNLLIHQGLGIKEQTGRTPHHFHYFGKNQLFDLRPDLARSWVLPGDWRPRNAILSTFWCIRFLLI